MAPPPLGSGSATNSESSVLFSLSELMDLESERLADEESARQAEVRAQERARHQEERRLRDAEAARLLRAEEERRQADLERREEAARFGAIAQAELERVRLTSQNELRLRLLAESQKDEQNLAFERESRAKKRLRQIVAVSILLTTGAVLGGYLWANAAKREAQAQLAQMEFEVAERRRSFDEQIGRMTEQMNRLDALDASRREQMQREIDALRRQKDRSTKGTKTHETPRGPRQSPPTPPTEQPRCQEGDPMCPL